MPDNKLKAVGLRATAVWCAILGIAIINGLLRTWVLAPLMSSPISLTVSGIILSVAVFIITWLSIRWINPSSSKAAEYIGVLWVVLTAATEMAMILGQGESWNIWVEQFDVSSGNLFALIMAVTLVSPRLAFSYRCSR
ncbi:Uncharacterised protein [BD1-7 clade bacterium]|uniref:Uncharacterized protein n=1 Tax=BD1-7 clade bacterium TaxID=2029982 RepID=A0A5S9QQP9_9GAMM|nr:Uncharacterised protein [BD1-7 clade bacterium]CAA0120957.1 Uncharacterised protein [BD1-7 clade bacterium]